MKLYSYSQAELPEKLDKPSLTISKLAHNLYTGIFLKIQQMAFKEFYFVDI